MAFEAIAMVMAFKVRAAAALHRCYIAQSIDSER